MDTIICIEAIAEICHETNRVYCEILGDATQVPWAMAPEWQKESSINGVKFCLENPDASPSQNHDNWLAEKIADGWTYGEVKDPYNKTHPCCVPYEELPETQKMKDTLFKNIVASFINK